MCVCRAYIHHLLCCREMTAEVLLYIQNVFILEQLFSRVRDEIREHRFDDYLKWFRAANAAS